MVNLKKLCGGYIVDAGDTFSKTLLLVSIVFFLNWGVWVMDSFPEFPEEWSSRIYQIAKSLYPNEANPGKRAGGEYPEVW